MRPAFQAAAFRFPQHPEGQRATGFSLLLSSLGWHGPRRAFARHRLWALLRDWGLCQPRTPANAALKPAALRWLWILLTFEEPWGPLTSGGRLSHLAHKALADKSERSCVRLRSGRLVWAGLRTGGARSSDHCGGAARREPQNTRGPRP